MSGCHYLWVFRVSYFVIHIFTFCPPRYLPVYMWKEKIKREKKDLYVELLAVVSKFNQEGLQEEQEGNQNQEEGEGSAADTWHCLFCGTEFQQTVEKKNHMKVCHGVENCTLY